MAILVLNQNEVERLLDMEGCIEAMAGVLEALARGELYQPLRSIAFPPGETSGMGLMPAHRSGASAAYALKTICLFPDNLARGLDAHQGTVTLFLGTTGEVRALMNASAITVIRTAAVSAVATRLLARDDLPEIKTGHIESPSPFSSLGTKGMGEGGGAAIHAICAAIQDALRRAGKAAIVNDSFNPPERVWHMIQNPEETAALVEVTAQ